MALPNYLEQAFETAFWDTSVESESTYRPKFIANEPGNTMQMFLDGALQKCDHFIMSVAFITRGGLAPLMQTLLDLEKHNVPGQIITTDYLAFTEPSALEILMGLKNIKLKMFCCDENPKGFHTKGYLFFKDKIVNIAIGSSNLTQKAISENKEWNISFASSGNGEIYKHIIEDFDSLWNSENTYEINEESLYGYKLLYSENKRLEKEKARALSDSKTVSIEQIKLTPNSMQLAFIRKLNEMRKNGANKALLISATGTGKTYAAAFALRDINPKRALFIVHREIILKQAMKSFRNVFGDSKSFGLYAGGTNESYRDFVFATMQTMTRHYKEFPKNAFEVIVIDEAHRSGAGGYQEMMKYFMPGLWLGMTASPDRPDGFDVYKTFDYNIAHEIRLQEAMRLNLLCPFHYYGITDIYVDGEKKENREFSNLVSDKRVDYVIEKARYFKHSGNRLKGLVFCSCVDEAEELAKKFAERGGYRTIALHSKMKVADIEETKEKAIQQLETDDYNSGLDYIFTCDMFNEGVDIPQVNQVIMLRPTESPIIFVQQLGRGLRKATDKEYVMILDFIGNYSNDYMIPVALSGDRTYNRDNIRRYVREGSKVLYGASSIHFDEIAKERIFRSIDNITNISTIIKNSYQTLKFKLGRKPTLIDFWKYGEVDPLLILNNYENYYRFQQKMEKDSGEESIDEQDSNYLTYLSTIIPKGLLPEASNILNILLLDGRMKVHDNISQSTLSILQGSFLKKTFYNDKKKGVVDQKRTNSYWSNNVSMIELENGFIKPSKNFERALKKDLFKKNVEDLIALSFARYNEIYKPKLFSDNPFALYEKYSRQDISLVLNSDKDLSSTMYGKWRQKEDVCIFVTYHKAEAGEEKEYLDGKPNYADEFSDDEIFFWDTKIGQDENSSYMESVETATRKHLFVKKSDGEGTDFYYMGEFDIIGKKHASKKDNNGKEQPIAKVTFKMKNRVKQDLLDYLKAN